MENKEIQNLVMEREIQWSPFAKRINPENFHDNAHFFQLDYF